MDAKKKLDDENKRKQREEDEKLERRMQEQQEKMQREFEEEQNKKKEKERAVSGKINRHMYERLIFFLFHLSRN